MKLNISVIYTRKDDKSLTIRTENEKIEVKEENSTTVNARDIISPIQAFYVDTQILVFLAILTNKLQL